MSHLLRVGLVAALLSVPSLSLAQTVFDVDGSLNNRNGITVGTFSGTIDINTTTGDIVGWSISMPPIPPYPASAAVGAFTFNSSDSTAVFSAADLNESTGYLLFYAADYRLTFQLLYANMHTLTGFNGATLSGGPNGSGYGIAPGEGFAINGAIVPSPVPEPSTLVLMASGLLGLVCFRRKLPGVASASRCE